MLKAVGPVGAAAVTLSVALSAAAADSADASLATPSSPAQNASDAAVRDSQERAEAYWTRDRMRAAKPMPTPRISRQQAEPGVPGSEADGDD